MKLQSEQRLASGSHFEQDLSSELDGLARKNLRRQLRWLESSQATQVRVSGRNCLNFSSNDYLGLASHPDLKKAAIKAIEQFGTGSGASRLISGSLPPHRDLEERLAGFKKVEAALAFSTGYATALGSITALMKKTDVVVLDRLVHASIIDASRLSGAGLLVFPHNDMPALDRILKRLDQRTPSSPSHRRRRVLIATESVFSMDGDLAPLPELVALKDRYGAILMVDEAHATGLYGPGRSGLAETFGLGAHIEVQMGTLGKALGAAGGFIAGSRVLIDSLLNQARSFIFSTAPAPADVAAACAGIDFVQSPAGAKRCEDLRSRIIQFYQETEKTNLKTLLRQLPHGETSSSLRRVPGLEGIAPSPIVPMMMGAEADAVALSKRLQDQGFLVPAVRYPAVPKGKARLRISLSALHTPAEISRLAGVLSQEWRA